MIEILAVFRSRSQAMDCNARLKALNIGAVMINTPKECGVGCGLSIKIPHNAFVRAKAAILRGGYSAFYGFYKMQNIYGRIAISRM